MSRGRPRKVDPTLPPHIDPRRLPKGAYWDRSSTSWYTITPDPKPRRVTLADATATLADLHLALEDFSGVQRGTVSWLLDLYHQSSAFNNLAASTRASYETHRRAVSKRPTRAGELGKLRLAGITRPAVQALVESITQEGTPSKANHLLRYLRLVFRWAMNLGHAPATWRANPADGVTAAKERRQFSMPSKPALAAVLAYARAGASRTAHTTGSVAPYLWCIIEIAYRCRLRGIEVVTLTDANATPEGIATNRRKGSRDNIVPWTLGLREAWTALLEYRDTAQKRHKVPVQITPGGRAIVVSQEGQPLSKSGLDTAWNRLIRAAIASGVIDKADRFTLHGLKHRGITDTKGNRADKQTASGHKSAQMLDRYDHELPVVKPAGE